MKPARSEARNTTRSATSSGRPMRPSGCCRAASARNASTDFPCACGLLGGQPIPPLGRGRPRAHGVDEDPVRGPEVGERPGEVDQPGVGDASGHVRRRRVPGRRADDVHDASPAPRPHGRDRHLGHPHVPEDLQPPVVRPLLGGRRQEVAAPDGAGVVHQDLEPAEARHDGVHDAARRRRAPPGRRPRSAPRRPWPRARPRSPGGLPPLARRARRGSPPPRARRPPPGRSPWSHPSPARPDPRARAPPSSSLPVRQRCREPRSARPAPPRAGRTRRPP